MSYSGVIYNTAVDKTSWEAVSISKSGGDFLSQSIGLSGGVVKIVGTDSFASFDINFTDTDGVKKFRRMFLESNGNAGIQLFTEDGTFVEHDNIITSKGGTFVGNMKARTDTATTGSYLRNISVKSNSTDVSTMSIYFTRE